MNFDFRGPYKIQWSRDDNKDRKIDRNELLELKRELQSQNLGRCRGCYMFTLKYGDKYIPYYIGQAVQNDLITESFAKKHKLEIYDDVVKEGRGWPYIFYFPKLTPTGKYAGTAKKGSDRSIDFLEDFLIASALQKNSGLRNVKKTGFWRDMHVAGRSVQNLEGLGLFG